MARIRTLAAGKCLAARAAFRQLRDECEPAMQALRLALPGEIPRTGHQYKSTDAIASVLFVLVKQRQTKSNYGNLAFGENLRALRLENAPLRGSLSDLRAANANPARRACGSTRRVRFLVRVTNTKSTDAIASVLFVLVTRTGIEPMFPA